MPELAEVVLNAAAFHANGSGQAFLPSCTAT